MAPRRQWHRRVLYALVVLVLCLGGIECAARLAGHVLVERRRGPTSGDDGADMLVLAVGDSWTWGSGVEPEEAWPARLEARLRGAYGLDVSVVNLGRPGAAPLKVLQDLRAWDRSRPPDLVLYLAGANHDPYDLAVAGGVEPDRIRQAGAVLGRLATYRILQQVVARRRVERDRVLARPIWKGRYQGPRQDRRIRRDSIHANLARVADLAASFGADLIVLTYPLLPALDHHREEGWYELPRTNAWIRGGVEKLGLDLLDLEAAWAEAGAGPEFLVAGLDGVDERRTDLHPGPLGHEDVARRVASHIAGEPPR